MKNIKSHDIYRIVLIILFLLINISNINAQNKYEVISETNIDVRSVPSTRATLMGYLSPKTQIEVIRFAGTWAEFTFNGKIAYVSSKHIRKLQDVTDKGEVFEVISVSRLNIRQKPTTESKIMGTLDSGERIEVFSISGAWAEIRYNNTIGYVSTKYIRKVEEIVVDILDEKDSIIEMDTIKFIVDTISDEKDNFKEIYNLKLIDNVKMNFVPNIYCGYTNFYSNNASPKGRFGCGIDLGIQFLLKDDFNFIPKDYFAEVSLGYSLKGSAIFPMHYFNIKLYPFGYRYNLSDIVLCGKLGLYTGITSSEIITNYNYFDSSIDFGLLMYVGIEYGNCGIGVSYEQGLNNVCNSNLSLRNSCVFINVSYQLLSLNKNFKQQLRWKNL